VRFVPLPPAAYRRLLRLLLVLMAMAGLPAVDIALSVDQPLPVVGSTITVSVTLNNASPFDTWGLQVDFNNGYLQLVSQSAGSYATFVPDARPLSTINGSGEIHLGGYSPSDGNNTGGASATLAVLQFVVLFAGSPTIATVPRDTAHPFGDTLFTSTSPTTFSSLVPVSDAALTITARNLDVVTLNAAAVNATASGSSDGSFTITRSGSIGSITVPLQVSGSAVPGTDYVALPGSVTFTPGVSSLTVGIHGLDNTAIDGTQTITLDILPGASYTIGSSRSSQALLLDDLGPTTSITVDHPTIQVGQTLTVTLAIANAPTFLEWGELLSWSPGSLQLLTQSAGDFSAFVPDARSLSQIDAASEVHAGGYGSAIGSGRLAVFTFRVLAAGSILLAAPAQGGGMPFGFALFDASNHLLVPLAAPPVTVNAAPADVITISSTQPVASEVGPTPAYVTVSRDRTVDAQTVSLLATGTTSPALWVSVPSSVTFIPGQSSVTFPLLPIADHSVEGTLSLVLTIGPGPLYTVGNPSAVSITRLDADGSDLSLTSNTPRPALTGTVQVMIHLDQGPAFSQFGGIVRFPVANLSLLGQSAGSAGFGTFVPDARSLAQINASGEVHVGTYTTDDQAGGSGDLVVLTFSVVGAGTAVLTTADQTNGVPFGDALLSQGGQTTLPTISNVLTLQISADHAPTAIALSHSHLQQGLPIGTLVGLLTDTDPDLGDYASYALVANGAASADNGHFTIAGNELVTNYVFDYSLQQSALITIQATDSGGLTFQQAFTITIDAGGGVLYVRQGATGSGNGSSWANAFTDLAPALAVANAGTQVWVAGGTYRPTAGTDPTKSLTIPAGVAVYGGFAGTEAALARTWPSHLTTLTGVISGGAARHVVTLAAGASLDGVVVSGGDATSTSADQSGAGVLIGAGAASASLSHCIITGNHAAATGGGVYSQGAPTVITNCVLDSNRADSGCGGFAAASGAHSLTADTCTNDEGFSGGALEVTGSASLSVLDCLFDANTVPALHDGSSAALTFSSCCVPDGSVAGGDDLGGNLTVDPLLLNVLQPAGQDGIWFTSDDGVQESAVSPCRLAGVAAGLPDDLFGNARPGGGGVDIGACEFEVIAGTAPTITSPLTASGQVGVPFSFTLVATGTAPIGFTASPLPSGLALAQGVISGTPQSAGTTSITVNAANGVAYATPVTLVVTIAAAGAPVAPVLTCPLTATAYVGVPFAFPITTTGTQPVSVAASPLPSGLSLFGNTIQGTPTAVSTTYINLGASNSAGIAAPQSLLLTIIAPVAPSFIGPTSLVAILNQPFTYVIGANGTLPITFSASPLPTGLSYSAGAISGTPTVTGSTVAEVTATNVAGAAIPENLSITVDVPATLTSPVSVNGVVGVAFTYTPTASGTTPITFTASPLPPGMSFDGTTLSGTPTTSGTTAMVVTATNPTGPTATTVMVTISALAPPVFISNANAFGTVGQFFDWPLAASGAAPITYAITSGALTDGLSLAGGVITGTPSTAGTQSVTITATGPGGQATQVLTLTVEIPVGGISSGLTASGFVGSTFTYTIVSTGTNLSYAATPLPPGLSLAGNVISGTPTALGTTSVVLAVTNDISSDTKTLVVTIAGAVAPVITSAPTVDDPLGTAVSFQMTADGTQPITYAITSGTLPANLTLSASGLLSGLPAAIGTTAVTVTASNSFGSAPQTLTIVVQVAPSITSATSDTGTVGTPYSYVITATGTLPQTDTATPLPPGLTLTGTTISGTPTTAGTTLIALSAANQVASASQNLSLVIAPAMAPSLPATAAAQGIVGAPFSLTLTAGGSIPITFTQSGLPAGLTLSGATISGTPTAAGVSLVTITATNAGGQATQDLTLTFQVPASISSPLTASGTVGTPFTYTLTAAGTAPIILNATGLPAGLSYAGGVISGTPLGTGTTTILLTAQNLVHTDTQDLLLSVVPPTAPVFTSPDAALATVGASFTFTLAATGSIPLTFTSATLPAGLALSGDTISGTPTAAGVFPVVITATNAAGPVTQTLTFTQQIPPAITSALSAAGTVGSAFTYQIVATGTAVSYSTSQLPAGLILLGDTISGAPTASGTTLVTLMAGNLVGTDTRTLTIDVSPATAPVFTSSSAAAITVGAAISLSLTASGSQPITYSAIGLPAGLTLSGGIITGSVAAAGISEVALTATNAGGSGTQTLELTAQVPALVTNTLLTASGTVGTPFLYTVTVSGTAPITITASGLPSGLGIANGLITGAPTASGVFTVTLSAANLINTDSKTLTLSVVPATVPVLTSPATALATDHVAFSFPLSASGSVPITFTTSALPSGLALSGATITGTPAVAGVFDITITASNAGGSGTQDLMLTIQDQALITSALSASGTVGVPFTYIGTASGSTPIAFSASPLPGGLSLSGATISGIPTASGTTAVTLTAANLVHTDTQTLQITIASATGPVITSPSSVVAPVGVAFSFPITATGIPAPTISTTALPPGLSLVGSTITGLPTTAGITAVTVTAANPGGTVTQGLSITLQVPPALAAPAPVQGTVGSVFSYTIAATGTALGYQASPLPAGVTLTGNVLSGIPTTVGPTAVVLTVANLVGAVSQTLDVTILPGQAPVFTSAAAASAQVGQPFSYTLTASSVSAVTFAAAPLPTGLTFNGTVLSGTPVSAGVDAITLSATNLNGTTPLLLTLTVQQAPLVVSALSATGTVGSPFTYTIVAAGSLPQTITAAPLPPGLSLVGAVLSGTPSATGVTDTVLTVSNGAGSTTPTLIITITPSTRPVITSSLSLEGVVGAKLDYTITASGTAPITFGASALPPGMGLSGAALGGIPSAVGTTSVVLSASNAGGSAIPRTLVITIDPATAPVIVSPATASGTVGAPFVYSINATGSQPIAFTASPLPPGLVRIGQTISGTPSATGATQVTMTAVNAGGSALPVILTLTISAPVAPALTSPLALSGTVGVPLTYLLTAQGTPPVRFAASSLPPGLSLDGALISGIPTTPGITPLGVTLTDATGQTAVATLTVTIDPAVAPSITSALSASATVGTPFTYLITASGSGPDTVSAAPLPAWLTLTGAVLSGTPPDASGSPLAITLGASNSGGAAAPALLTLTIQAAVAPLFTSPGTAAFTVGTPADFPLIASGSQPLTFSLTGGTLPAGLVLSAGVISGTPSAATSGTVVQITATNAGGTATQPLTVIVQAAIAPTITVPPSLTGTVGSPFVAFITGLGSGPLTYQTTALPGGLTLSGNLISGTPQMPGQTLVGLTVGNITGTVQANVLIVIVAATPPAITSATTISATVGVPLLYQIATTGTAPVVLGLTGLPPGLALDGTAITGTPTTPGTSVATLTASNGGGTMTASLTITVQLAVAPQFTSPTTASGVIGATLLYTITATGTSPLTLATGALPPGFSLGGPVVVDGATQALLVGILPSTPQQLQITLLAQNGAGQAAQTLTIDATPPAPLVSQIMPLAGPDTGATQETLSGTDLDQVTAVAYDGVPAAILSASATALVVRTPAHGDGFVAVTFAYAGGSGRAPEPYGYLPPAEVVSIAPITSPTAGGITVSIDGTNLTGLSGVDDQLMITIGGVPALITYASETSVLVQAPAHAAGTVAVVVASLDGSRTFANAFTYSDTPVAGSATFGVTGSQTTAGGATAPSGATSGPGPGPADDSWHPKCGLSGGMSLVLGLGVWLMRRRRAPARRG